jgi:hypothetical protein
MIPAMDEIFDLDKKNEIQEHHKMSKIAKFGCEENEENIAL